jgi:hypothetical protein
MIKGLTNRIIRVIINLFVIRFTNRFILIDYMRSVHERFSLYEL